MQLLKRRLLSGGAWALGGRIALAFIGLATNALLARLLTPAELGAYFLAYSVVGISAALGALGLTKAVVRFVAESVGLGQYDRARRAVKIALGFGFLGASTVSLAYLLFGGAAVSSLFDSPALAAVSGVIAGWVVVTVIQGIIVETFRGFHDIRLTVTFGGLTNGNGILTSGLLSLTLFLLLIFRGEASLSAVMALAAGSGAVSALMAGGLLRRKMYSLPQDISNAKPLRTAEVANVAWPLMVTNLAMGVVVYADLWVAGAFLPQADVGAYGAAVRLMLYVAVPLQLVNMIVPPIIAEMYAQGRTRELERNLRAVATMAGIPAFLLLAAFVVFGGLIMGLVFGEQYREAAVLLALLSLGQMVNVWAGSCRQALMMTGHQTTMMSVTIISGLITFAGAIWAVQYYGAVGVAAATASSLAIQNVVMLLLVKRKLGIWTHVKFAGLRAAR